MTTTIKDAERLADEILRRHSRGPAAAISHETRLSDLVTSLGLIVVILELERALGGRPFDVTKLGTLVTVGDLLGAVSGGTGR